MWVILLRSISDRCGLGWCTIHQFDRVSFGRTTSTSIERVSVCNAIRKLLDKASFFWALHCCLSFTILNVLISWKGYGLVISIKHQFLGRTSWPKYLSEYSTKPGYGKLGWPDDELSPSLLHELLPVVPDTPDDADEVFERILCPRRKLLPDALL
jgi:hypothetical protein